mmetsp:Transcript_2551/g.5852  ORF Transcript_2551/g.5852 Transcript_2551/m.5852 type:complete len:375 (+) Transcript_2551:573-1697(+)
MLLLLLPPPLLVFVAAVLLPTEGLLRGAAGVVLQVLLGAACVVRPMLLGPNGMEEAGCAWVCGCGGVGSGTAPAELLRAVSASAAASSELPMRRRAFLKADPRGGGAGPCAREASCRRKLACLSTPRASRCARRSSALSNAALRAASASVRAASALFSAASMTAAASAASIRFAARSRLALATAAAAAFCSRSHISASAFSARPSFSLFRCSSSWEASMLANRLSSSCMAFALLSRPIHFWRRSPPSMMSSIILLRFIFVIIAPNGREVPEGSTYSPESSVFPDANSLLMKFSNSVQLISPSLFKSMSLIISRMVLSSHGMPAALRAVRSSLLSRLPPPSASTRSNHALITRLTLSCILGGRTRAPWDRSQFFR